MLYEFCALRIKMKKIELYELSRNSDQTEGRGSNVPVAYFNSLSEVVKVNEDKRFYEKCGVMGTKYSSLSGGLPYNINERTICVYDSAEEFFESYDRQTKIDKAMAKLTEEEKKLLGLKK